MAIQTSRKSELKSRSFMFNTIFFFIYNHGFLLFLIKYNDGCFIVKWLFYLKLNIMYVNSHPKKKGERNLFPKTTWLQLLFVT